MFFELVVQNKNKIKRKIKMLILRNTYFILAIVFILSACSQNSINKDNTLISKKEIPIVKKKVEKKVKIIPKKKIIKKTKKKYPKYKYCNKHTKTMTHASLYIKDEFEKGYFVQKDVIGAKAQLFLVESNSPTLFAKNINAAQKSYIDNFKLAKKNRCNIKKFKVFPIFKIKNRLKILEKDIEKKEMK